MTFSSREKGKGAVDGEARGRDEWGGNGAACKVGLTFYACLMQRTVPVLGSSSRCKSELLDPDRQDGESCGPQDGSAVASEKKPKKRSLEVPDPDPEGGDAR